MLFIWIFAPSVGAILALGHATGFLCNPFFFVVIVVFCGFCAFCGCHPCAGAMLIIFSVIASLVVSVVSVGVVLAQSPCY